MKVTAIVCCLLFCCCLGERDCIYGSRPFHDTRYRYSSLPYPNLQTKARSNANDSQPAKSPSGHYWGVVCFRRFETITGPIDRDRLKNADKLGVLYIEADNTLWAPGGKEKSRIAGPKKIIPFIKIINATEISSVCSPKSAEGLFDRTIKEELSSGNDIGSAGRSSTTEDIGRREELRALFRRVSVLLKRRENALKDIKFMLELRRYAHSEREAAAKPAPPT